MEEKFQAACQKVKKFTKTPPDSDLLELYAFYKQALVGDINIARPTDTRGRAKWDAWNQRKGMSQHEAMVKYVDLAKNMGSKYE